MTKLANIKEEQQQQVNFAASPRSPDAISASHAHTRLLHIKHFVIKAAIRMQLS